MFLLVKGCNGFGNMISILNTAYQIAHQNNMTLVIDWTHPEWKLGFDNYFELNNVNYLSYDKFKQIFNKDMKIIPEIFNKDNLFQPLCDSLPTIDKDNKYAELFDPVINNLIHNKNFTKSADIVVFAYNWLGYNNIKFFWNNLILKNELKIDIEDKIKRLETYIGIHVRHTDNKNISCNWAIDIVKDNKDKNIYFATDNEIVLNLCKAVHPKIFNFTTFYEKGQPLHTLNKINTIKHQINIDTIRDINILASSTVLKITPIKTIPYMTTYSLLAMALKNS
jgi:hypothetical protein